MTNFKQTKGNKPRGGNRKDGGSRRQSLAGQSGFWGIEGFMPAKEPGRWTYTWQGDFPVFNIRPGMIAHPLGLQSGLVAEYKGIRLEFPYGTPPAGIKARLDDEILAIMQHDAEIVEAELNYNSWVASIKAANEPLWVRSAYIDQMMAANDLTRDEAADMFKGRD
jgi:hypothetical protein